jgi:hypothetical protein
MARQLEQQTLNAAKVPWTEAVLSLLRDWQRRAAVSQEAHYARATRLADYNIWFGVPVVALATLVGTSVFATPLHPEYLAERSDPKKYLDDLRRRMDEVSAQSLEIGERDLTRACCKLGAEDIEPRDV